MNTLQEQLFSILPHVSKPGRYWNHEMNARHKSWQDRISIALAFPDLYEIGMSHLGLRKLYAIVNRHETLVADRVYAVWPDFEEALRNHKIPLYGLESGQPLHQFDVIGFTLQTELSYTNILNMLDLSQIPVFSKERTEKDPLIIAGGPCASNPEPLADFIDVFIIGDGEEILPQFLQLKHEIPNKHDFLREAAQLTGVYIPAQTKQTHTSFCYGKPVKHNDEPISIAKNIVMDLSRDEFSTYPNLMPLINITHNRLSLEVMRGCPNGCRFCQAGFIYRPLREQNPNFLMHEVEQEMQQNGWEEISFLSLSSSDYQPLVSLAKAIDDQFGEQRVSLSLPSLRIESFRSEIGQIARKHSKSGLTFAPEAGSQRLRDAINKNITESEIMEGINLALQFGWRKIKLYFMIGLPTETDDDVREIGRLLCRIAQKSRQLQISAAVSIFVPRPFTPFQWEAQIDRAEAHRRVGLIKQEISSIRRIQLRHHDPKTSLLEGIISRSTRQIGSLIYQAFRNGAKLDQWTEHFSLEPWEKATEALHLNWDELLMERDRNQDLPWEFLEEGFPTRQFLLQERKQAYNTQTSPKCTQECTRCGICNNTIQTTRQKNLALPSVQSVPTDEKPNQERFFYTLFYHRGNGLRFLSQKDWLKLIYRFLRLTKLPLVYSQGFSTRPKITLSPPLPLGATSDHEYITLALTEEIDPQYIAESWTQIHIPDFQVIAVEPGKVNNPIGEIVEFRNLKKALTELNKTDRLLAWQTIELEHSGKVKPMPEVVLSISDEREIAITKKMEGARPSEIAFALLEQNSEWLRTIQFHRKQFLF